jgi:hypothetical protein
MTTCSSYSIALTVLIILIIAFADDIFTRLPVLSKLFTDAVNFLLLVTLCILVLLLDMPSGILLTFLVLYLAVWIKQWLKSKKERFSDIKNANSILTNNPLSNIPREYASESEINYNKPSIPNGNISPFQPVTPEQIIAQTPQIRPSIACNQNDSLSQVGPLNRDGYDCVGCRYDMKDSPQNLTKWGQPLARCGTYDASKVSKWGTVFYPLNA